MIGRKKESLILKNTLTDDTSHFVAVYGRRRVGKTFLVREVFDERFTFQHAGVFEGSLKEQLFAFSSSLSDAGFKLEKKPKNWMESFECLKELIRNSQEKKKVIFIDELSWMDTPKSDLMKALENFWNGWASGRKNIILIVCASATSWMLSNVIHNKGGLYNRLTECINLHPFALDECEEYVKAKGLVFNRSQVLQYFMIFGGVPYYWSFLKKGLSLTQCVDKVLFDEDAPLKDEFRYLFASIFKKPEIYLKIIAVLAKKKAGMTREEVIGESGIINSGDLTKKLEELESSGFIRKYYAFGKKKKNAVYQLMDPFTLFYYQFMEKKTTDPEFWSNQINTPRINSWAGLAFERAALCHIDKIKQKLGINGIYTEVNSWYCKADPDKGIRGSQIDLLIVRRDDVINLCEMKYSNTEYSATAETEADIGRKVSDLRISTGTRSAIHPILVTTYGLLENSYSDVFQSVITLDDLFRA